MFRSRYSHPLGSCSPVAPTPDSDAASGSRLRIVREPRFRAARISSPPNAPSAFGIVHDPSASNAANYSISENETSAQTYGLISISSPMTFSPRQGVLVGNRLGGRIRLRRLMLQSIQQFCRLDVHWRYYTIVGSDTTTYADYLCLAGRVDKAARNPGRDCRALHAERQVAREAEDRHFPDLPAFDPRHVVKPLRL